MVHFFGAINNVLIERKFGKKKEKKENILEN